MWSSFPDVPLSKSARHTSELHVRCYFSISAPSGFLRWLLKGKVLLEVVVQILCVEVKITSLLGERRKGQEKSPYVEQAVAHCHHESSCRKRVRPKLYNPQVRHCCTGRPVGSPVTISIIKSPITHVPSHTCCRWILVSAVGFTGDRLYCKQLQSWEVSSKGADPHPGYREAVYKGGLTKLAGTAAGHTKVKTAPSNCFQ